MPSVTVTRRQLYERVWSEPMSRLSKAFGISDVGLAKICRKHQIPRPPRGYWAKKSVGRTPKQIPLPNPGEESSIEIRESTSEPALSDSLQQQVSARNGKQFQVELKDNLRGAHPLTSEANQQFQSAKYDDEGLLGLPEKSPLNVRASKPSLRRALFILDALLRALESHGEAVSPGPCVTLLGISVRFGIFEQLEAKQEEDDEPADLSGEYLFRHSRFRTKRVPSGRLTLQIRDSGHCWRHRCRHTWRDTPKKQLEQQLDSILSGLTQFAAAMRQQEEDNRRDEEARAAAAQRRQEEERQRAIRRAEIKAEKKRFADLLEESRRWQQSRTLQEYIEAARQAHLTSHGAIDEGSEMANWIAWASQHADWLNPLMDSPPSILDEEESPERHDGAYSQHW